MAVITGEGLRKTWVAAIVVSIGYSVPASALEFGTLSVRSHLNQPLDATVVLDHLSASDRADLDVGIAPPEMFKRFGIRRSSAVDRMQIDTRYDKQGHRAYVQLSTQRPINEPFVDFLLQANAGNGSALREYTAMLDPSAAETASAAAGLARDASSATGAPQASMSSASTGPHQVHSGETLWSIAAANTPSGARVAQTMLAIYDANRSAFDGSMAALSRGATLSLPSAATIRAVDASQAEQRFAALKPASGGQTNASSAGASGGQRAAASGEAPPARLKTSPSSMTGTGTTAEHTAAGPQDVERFGRLSPSSDAPWPRPATATTVSAGNTDGTTAATDSNATGSAASASARSGQTDAAPNGPSAVSTDNGATAAGTDSTTAVIDDTSTIAGDSTPRPTDVASGGGSWLSLRNLLLFGVVLLLILLGVRRWRERGYKRIDLETEPGHGVSESESVAAANRSGASDSPASLPDSADDPGAARVPQPGHAETSPVAHQTPASAHAPPRDTGAFDRNPSKDLRDDGQAEDTAMGGAVAATTTVRTDNDDSTAETPAAIFVDEDSDDKPRPGAVPTDSHGNEHEKRDALSMNDPVSPRTATHADLFKAPDDRLVKTAPVDIRTAPRPKAATHEEIESLAFESQPLPELTERRHDLGDHEHSGLVFETEARQTSHGGGADTPPETSLEDREPDEADAYGLEMIDPGEFDLYDPSSETVAPTDDDSSDSVEIRLDLARMYIGMDDNDAARALLEDVRERGDDDQRRAATELLERI